MIDLTSGEEVSDGLQGSPEPILRATEISMSFGGVKALSDVTLDVAPAQITGLIGPNGAGKSTLLGIISGFIRPSKGTVHFDGDDMTSKSPQARARHGLARTFQQPELFAELTVSEHLTLAYRSKTQRRRLITDLVTGRGLLRPSGEERDRVNELIELLDLGGFAQRQVLELPLGASRLVEIGRALATRPQVVLLDEPSSGLDRHETEALTSALMRVVSDQGVGLVLVEHDVDMVLGASSTVYVLDFGELIAQGVPSDIRADEKVKEAYLGEDVEERPGGPRAQPELRPRSAEGHATDNCPLLEVQHLHVSYGCAKALTDVSLRIARGSAVAVLGVNGSGKSTLSRAICGLVPPSQGTIKLDGEDISHQAAFRIREFGIAYLPEGRGIFPGLSVHDNLKVAVQILPRAERAEAIDRAIEMFPVLGSRTRQQAGSLSGGEQQMLSLVRGLAVSPKLLIADELSLGLAPLVVDTVFEGLERARVLGITLVIIEQFVKRALEFADEAVVLKRGSVRWQGTASTAALTVVDSYIGS